MAMQLVVQHTRRPWLPAHHPFLGVHMQSGLIQSASRILLRTTHVSIVMQQENGQYTLIHQPLKSCAESGAYLATMSLAGITVAVTNLMFLLWSGWYFHNGISGIPSREAQYISSWGFSLINDKRRSLFFSFLFYLRLSIAIMLLWFGLLLQWLSTLSCWTEADV